MTRAEYMAKLSEKLYFIPETQRKAILDYYEEMMADRMEDGMDETSAVSAMENPDTIAERLKAEGNFPMEEAQGDNPENLTDEAMKFSSLAGSLLRTFEDLEKAGHVETPEPPVPPTPPTPPEPPKPADDTEPRNVTTEARNFSGSIEEMCSIGDMVSSAMDYIQRHTTESLEGDYEKKVFTCPASQVRAIRLLCGEMPIRVTACEGNELTLTYYTCDDDPYEMNLDDGVLTLERPTGAKGGSRFNFSMLGGVIKMVWNKPSPTVELLLPREALVDLQAHTTNCSIKVSDCQALCQTELKTGNSRIEVSDLSCLSLECASTNGRLVLHNIRSRQQLTGRTTNSRIEAGGLRSGGDMKLTTTNSHIEGRDLQSFGSLHLTTSNTGLLAEDCTAKGELRLTTSNGSLEVWRSEGASVTLKTSNSSIRGQMPGAQADWAIDSRTSNGKNSLPKQQPGGKPLTVHTSNGSIDVHFERE